MAAGRRPQAAVFFFFFRVGYLRPVLLARLAPLGFSFGCVWLLCCSPRIDRSLLFLEKKKPQTLSNFFSTHSTEINSTQNSKVCQNEKLLLAVQRESYGASREVWKFCGQQEEEEEDIAAMAGVARMAVVCARPTASGMTKTITESRKCSKVSFAISRPSSPSRRSCTSIMKRSSFSLGFSGSSTLRSARLPRVGFSAALSDEKIVRTSEEGSHLSKSSSPSSDGHRHGYGGTVIISAAGYKLKTHKASAKRFRVTGSGKIVRRRAGKQHLLMKKNTKRRNRLSKMVFVKKCDTENIVGALPYLKVAKRSRIH